VRNIIWLIVLRLAACASVQQQQEVYIAPQLNAPVQIVSITPYGNNLLARVIVKNNTDRYVHISLSQRCGLLHKSIHKTQQTHGNSNRTRKQRHGNQVQKHEGGYLLRER
jgi:hypothetical protein